LRTAGSLSLKIKGECFFDFIFIMGLSGNWKITLLHMLRRLDIQASDAVTFDGKDIYKTELI